MSAETGKKGPECTTDRLNTGSIPTPLSSPSSSRGEIILENSEFQRWPLLRENDVKPDSTKNILPFSFLIQKKKVMPLPLLLTCFILVSKSGVLQMWGCRMPSTRSGKASKVWKSYFIVNPRLDFGAREMLPLNVLPGIGSRYLNFKWLLGTKIGYLLMLFLWALNGKKEIAGPRDPQEMVIDFIWYWKSKAQENLIPLYPHPVFVSSHPLSFITNISFPSSSSSAFCRRHQHCSGVTSISVFMVHSWGTIWDADD